MHWVYVLIFWSGWIQDAHGPGGHYTTEHVGAIYQTAKSCKDAKTYLTTGAPPPFESDELHCYKIEVQR